VAPSGRVVVMSPHPGRITGDHTIDLPRPRSVRALQSVNRFHELVAHLWEELA
jgi:NitT/TauT family transport system ATP-binding protein